METETKKLRNALGMSTNAFLQNTIIQRAQEFTGLKTKGVKTLLKKVLSIKRAEQKKKQTENAKKHNLSRKEYLALQTKAKNILKDFSTGYSMGDLKQLYLNNKLFATYSSRTQYSGRYKGSERHGRIAINMGKKELRGIENVEGVWTIKLKGGKAKWIEVEGSKSRYRLNWKKGYLIGSSHAETREEALRLEATKRKVFEKLTEKEYVGIDVIKKLGACDVGIDLFCKKHGLNKEYGYQLGYLKSLGGEGVRYFNRLIKTI